MEMGEYVYTSLNAKTQITVLDTMTTQYTHDNGSYSLRLNGDPVSVAGAAFNYRHETIRLDDGQLQFLAGIDAEILAVTKHYEEVTNRFEARLNDKYQFRGTENHSNEWFHKADFWPYKWDSADNIYHYIRYASTEFGDSVVESPDDAQNNTYPFPEEQALTYFDPDEDRVRVFAAGENAELPARSVCAQVFEPRMQVFFALPDEDRYFSTSITATPMEEIESPLHDLEQLDSDHVTAVAEISLNENNELKMEPHDGEDYELSGELWDIIAAISRKEEPWELRCIVPQPRDLFTPHRFFL